MADIVGSGPGPFRVEPDGSAFVIIDESTGRPSAPFPTRADAEWWITTQPTPVKSPPPDGKTIQKPDTSNAAAPEQTPGLK